MGKKAEDFDGQIIPIRMAYLRAADRGAWLLATHYVNMLNKTVRPRNRVKENDGKTDMKPFKPRDDDIRQRTNTNEQACAWCFKREPMVEDAVSLERDGLLRGYEES